MPEAIASRLIGSLFVERGLVSESQIRVALEIQRESGEQLGKILVEQFNVPRKELTRVVAEQWRDVYGDGASPEGGPGETWRPLGEIFLTRGFVTEDELDEALRRQRQTGERLGEALVALGVISKFELAGALGEQMATLRKAEAEAEELASQDNVVALPERAPEPAVASSNGVPEPFLEAVPDEPTVEPEPQLLFETVTEEPHVEAETEAEVEVEATSEHELELEDPVEFEIGATADEAVELVADVEAPDYEILDPVDEWTSASVDGLELETATDEPDVAAEAEPEPEHEPLLDDPSESDVAETEDEAVELAAEAEAPESPILEPFDEWTSASVDGRELEASTFVAYASTPKGYQLVELDGDLPEVGQTIDLPDFGELVVTRIGRSPLPLDTRVCLFVEQSLSPVAALQHA
jgi:hypothetical protein